MEYKQLSGRQFPRFSGIKTFFRMPHVAVDADYNVGIFGIPFDGGTSYRPGARFAPAKIREVTSLARGFNWDHDINSLEKLKVADIGDCPTVPIDLLQTYQKIESFVSNIVKDNKKFIAVGGDHSITLPILRSLYKKLKTPMNLIHFDAHFDTYPAAWGCEYYHATFARHAIEEGLINPKNSVQIGIRGPFAGKDDLDYSKKHSIHVASMNVIKETTIQNFVKTLPDFSNAPTYITFDVDCLDPAYAPGTGTPVPGGLTTYEVQQIFRYLKVKNLVGADIVEVSPAYDHSDITSLAAMDTMSSILSIMAKN